MSKCKVCTKQISIRHHAIDCMICNEKIHKKCNKLNDIDYHLIKSNPLPFFCIVCVSENFPFSSLSNDELSLLLSKNININFDTHPPDLNIFPRTRNANRFKDFNEYISSQMSSTSSDEENSMTQQVNCKYYDIEEFCSSKFDNSNSFSLLHMNIASLAAHSDELNTMLNILDFDFNIIGITESRIKQNISPSTNINIEGYTIEHTPTESSCGGALLYIHNKLQYKTRSDLTMYKSKLLESIFIEVMCEKNPTLSSVVYTNIQEWRLMNLTLNILILFSKKCQMKIKLFFYLVTTISIFFNAMLILRFQNSLIFLHPIIYYPILLYPLG